MPEDTPVIPLLHYSLTRKSAILPPVTMTMKKRLLAPLIAFSLLLSTPSLLRIPRVLPFLDAEVRAAAPMMLNRLRERGLWLVNTDLKKVIKDAEGICFLWDHRYTAVERSFAPEILTTCTYD